MNKPLRTWKREVDIQQFLTDERELTPYEILEIARYVSEKVNDELPEYDCTDIEGSEDVEELNEALVRLYDWADANGIWLGD